MVVRILLLLALLPPPMQTFAQADPSPTIAPIYNPNSIDSLRDSASVIAFIKSLDRSGRFQGLSYHPRLSDPSPQFYRRYRNEADSFGQRNFEKNDLNGDGRTDLLWNGYDTSEGVGRQVHIILFFDADTFAIRELPKEWYADFFAIRTIAVNGKALLRAITVHPATYEKVDHRSHLINEVRYMERRIDTLQIVSTWPLEWRRHHIAEIDTIRFFILQGSAPFASDFQLTIVGDSVEMIKDFEFGPGDSMNNDVSYVAKIDSATTSRLKAVVESMDLDNLKEKYRKGGSDQQTCFLLFSYDRGKRKKVQDYGIIGTYALNVAELILITLQDTQSWTKVASRELDFWHFYDTVK